MSRVSYGDETHHAIFLQWEAVDENYRKGMALMWTGSPAGTIDEVVSSIKDSAPEVCVGCGALRGALHKLGCDNEECAECKLQLIGCEHYTDRLAEVRA